MVQQTKLNFKTCDGDPTKFDETLDQINTELLRQRWGDLINATKTTIKNSDRSAAIAAECFSKWTGTLLHRFLNNKT